MSPLPPGVTPKMIDELVANDPCVCCERPIDNNGVCQYCEHECEDCALDTDQ